MAFYGFLIFLFYQFKINILVKSLLITLAVILILSIGISRIYLGVHYPSDVVGGFIAGFIWVIFCALIFNILKLFRKDIRA
jgi:undecaprenyl-diphosphatase